MLPIENEFNYRKTPFSIRFNRRYKNVEKSFRTFLINNFNLSPQKFFFFTIVLILLAILIYYIYIFQTTITEKSLDLPSTKEEKIKIEKEELKNDLQKQKEEENETKMKPEDGKMEREKQEGSPKESEKKNLEEEKKNVEKDEKIETKEEKKEEKKEENVEEIKDEVFLKIIKGEEPKTIKGKKEIIKRAFQYAWNGYKKDAMGFDLLCPISKKGENKYGGFGATIFSSLDTAILMNLEEIVSECDRFIEQVDFIQDIQIPFCDLSNIYIGSLLSAHTLRPKKDLYLKKAEKLVKNILNIFFFLVLGKKIHDTIQK
jgi:flagellar biosynthesis GTPase FlhF